MIQPTVTDKFYDELLRLGDGDPDGPINRSYLKRKGIRSVIETDFELANNGSIEGRIPEPSGQLKKEAHLYWLAMNTAYSAKTSTEKIVPTSP